jgi:hypothetical protein
MGSAATAVAASAVPKAKSFIRSLSVRRHQNQLGTRCVL